jgi:hypothetical protein
MDEQQEHPVELDEEAARLTFAKYGKEQEYIPAGRQLPPPGDHVEPEPESDNWKKPAELLAMVINAKLVPAWEVPQAEWEKWADALADCLEDIFPGGIGNAEKWGPYAKLAFVTGGVVMCGIDFETMTFKPRHPPKESDEEGPVEHPPQSAPRASSGGRFATGGDQ